MRPKVVLEAGDPQSLIALAETGRGVAVIPSTVRLARRKVRAVPILHAGVSLGAWGWIVWDPWRFLPGYARSFIDGIVEYASRDYPGRELEGRSPAVPRPKGRAT